MDDSTSIMAYAPYFKLEVSIIRQCARCVREGVVFKNAIIVQKQSEVRNCLFNYNRHVF